MARVTPLNNTKIKQAKPEKNKNYKLPDGDGLFLVVKSSGAKIWHFRYNKPFTKKQSTLSLGNYPEISLAKAREERKKAKELLANNIDPKKYRDDLINQAKREQSNSLIAVFNEWFNVKKENVKPKQANLIMGCFKNHLLPTLGDIPITELKAMQVIEVIKRVERQKKYDLTKRLCSRINEVMNYAVNTGRIENNPLQGITKAFKTVQPTPHPAVKPEQLPWLLKVVNNADLKQVTRCLFEWQLHTMARPNEASQARWDEIDLDKNLWVIPAKTMKMQKPHLVPLTEQMLAILEAIKPISGEQEYIFPSFSGKKGHIHSETVNKAFRRMGLKGIQTAHGLRSIASTTLNEQGFDYDVIEAALAHLDDNQVRRAYNRSDYMERRKKLMVWWSNHIEQCATGNFSMANSVKGLKLVSS